jgi:hypothetical protein
MRIASLTIAAALLVAGCGTTDAAPAETPTGAASASAETKLQTKVLTALKAEHGYTFTSPDQEKAVRRIMAKECAQYTENAAHGADNAGVDGAHWTKQFWAGNSAGLTKEQAGFLTLRTLNDVCKAL